MSDALSAVALPPLSLYIHIPWCIRKCPYCDFNSHAQPEQLPETAYIDALIADLRSNRSEVGGREIQTIFFGGGTPSLFSEQSIAEILQRAAQVIPFAEDVEITLEANPGTFEREKFAGFRAAGVNRLSIGVQSFNADQLQRLGRVHNPDEAKQAAMAARELFPRLNLDLMHGLPSQTPQHALADLKQAIELGADHLSWYQLTIEPNTEFHTRPPQLPVDETLWEIQEQGERCLIDAGFQQYEISAWSRPDKQAHHNLNYWQFGDYLGIGAGAHGKLTQADGRIKRSWQLRQPKAYMAGPNYRSGEEWIEPEALPFEFMMNALRLHQGVPLELYQARTGQPLSSIQPLLEQACERKLLSLDQGRIAPTREGRLFLNDLLEIFLD